MAASRDLTQTDWVGDAVTNHCPAVPVINADLENLIAQEFPEYSAASGAFIQTDLEEIIYGTQLK